MQKDDRAGMVPAIYIGIDLASPGSDQTMVTTSLGGHAPYPARGQRLAHVGNALLTVNWRKAKRMCRSVPGAMFVKITNAR